VQSVLVSLLAATTLALVTGCAGTAATAPSLPRRPIEPPPAALAPVAAAALTVTNGAVLPTSGGGVAIRAPSVRAVAEGRGGADVEVAFTYLGPSAELMPLASGEARRQIGLKLRAQDTCNVLYVMWHIEPTTGIHVALKTNPGRRTHAECGDGGYRTLPATWSRADVRAIRAGEPRTLRATIEGDLMRVAADGAPVWTGRLPPEALTLDGPVGFRSDNGEFDLVLRAQPPRAREAP
jgi:hypothetical protein